MRKNPDEEQLAHALDTILREDAEKREVRLSLIEEFLKTYRFIATTAPRRGAVIPDRIKLPISSSGR